MMGARRLHPALSLNRILLLVDCMPEAQFSRARRDVFWDRPWGGLSKLRTPPPLPADAAACLCMVYGIAAGTRNHCSDASCSAQ